MSKLFMKVGRLGVPRTFAWTSPVANSVGIDRNHYRQNEAESGEFNYLLDRDQHSSLGAGGQYEYRVYDLVEPPEWPYAIVWPDVRSVRDKYPHTCRIVDMSTGRESALTDTPDHAREIVALARAGKLKGSFH